MAIPQHCSPGHPAARSAHGRATGDGREALPTVMFKAREPVTWKIDRMTRAFSSVQSVSQSRRTLWRRGEMSVLANFWLTGNLAARSDDQGARFIRRPSGLGGFRIGRLNYNHCTNGDWSRDTHGRGDHNCWVLIGARGCSWVALCSFPDSEGR